MKATEYIAMALENGKGWTLGLINDMQDAPLQQPTQPRQPSFVGAGTHHPRGE
jgi:hypothetical protein